MRLTNAIRERVEEIILRKKGFDTKIESAERAIKKYLKAEWEKTYPNGIDNFKDWISTRSHFRVETATSYHYETVTLDGCIYATKGETPSMKMTPELQSLFDARDAARKEKVEAGEVVRAVLYSCTTTKQIHETAPELDKYMPEEGVAQSTGLVDMATVNKLRSMLGGL